MASISRLAFFTFPEICGHKNLKQTFWLLFVVLIMYPSLHPHHCSQNCTFIIPWRTVNLVWFISPRLHVLKIISTAVLKCPYLKLWPLNPSAGALRLFHAVTEECTQTTLFIFQTRSLVEIKGAQWHSGIMAASIKASTAKNLSAKKSKHTNGICVQCSAITL